MSPAGQLPELSGFKASDELVPQIFQNIESNKPLTINDLKVTSEKTSLVYYELVVKKKEFQTELIDHPASTTELFFNVMMSNQASVLFKAEISATFFNKLGLFVGDQFLGTLKDVNGFKKELNDLFIRFGLKLTEKMIDDSSSLYQVKKVVEQ